MATKKINWENDDPEWELVGVISGDLFDGTKKRRGRKTYTYTFYEKQDATEGTQLQYRVCSQIKQQEKIKCDRTITVVV